MFRALSDFIADITEGTVRPICSRRNDYRLAAAALLVHVMSIDGSRDGMRNARSSRHFCPTASPSRPIETETLVDLAIARDAEAVDLYAFTSVLNRALDEEGRRRICGDDVRGGLCRWRASPSSRDNLVWRAAELLNIGSRDRVRIRREVREDAEAKVIGKHLNDLPYDGWTATPAAEDRRILVILHQAHSVPGRIGARLEQRGFRLEACRPAIGERCLKISLPMTAWWCSVARRAPTIRTIISDPKSTSLAAS